MNTLPVDKWCDDFLKGQEDCIDGVEHKAGKSEAYDRGYAAEYELEQVLTEMTNGH